MTQQVETFTQQAYHLSSISSTQMVERESTLGSCPLAIQHFLWYAYALFPHIVKASNRGNLTYFKRKKSCIVFTLPCSVLAMLLYEYAS